MAKKDGKGKAGGSGSGGQTKREEVSSLDFLRGHVILGENNLSSVSSSEYPGVYADADEHFSLERFRRNFRLRRVNQGEELLEFDLIGIDASLANALRRVMIAEVPTMAIEKVFIMNNTSVIHDEILAHRLGLIPIFADPAEFEDKGAEEDPTDLNTIVFQMQIRCEKNPHAPADAADPKIKYKNSSVYSGDLEWQPQGEQEDRFAGAKRIRPVHDKILIAKLRPGQEIDITLHCERGIGKTHAKWSPVAVASYRLMPEITLLEDITGELADKLQRCFAPGVVEVKENAAGVRVARIANPRNDNTSREVQRHEDLVNKVHLAKKRDHFIFSVESVGFLQPTDIVKQALAILIEKTKAVKTSLAKLVDPDVADGDAEGKQEDAEMEASPAAHRAQGEEEEEEEDDADMDDDEVTSHNVGDADEDD